MQTQKAFYYDQLLAPPSSTGFGKHDSTFKRFRLPAVCLRDHKSTVPLPCPHLPDAVELCSAPSGELPTLSPTVATKPYRYYYSITTDAPCRFMSAIVKIDAQEGRQVASWSVAGHTPGEAIFVPDPERADEEDAGVLLSVVLDGHGGTSYLLCLDAKQLIELGRADTGGPIPFGTHGKFVGISGSVLDL